MSSKVIKIIVSIVLFIVVIAIIGIMKEAHIFGKTFLVFILLFVLKLIWAKSDNQQQTNSPQVNINHQQQAPHAQSNSAQGNSNTVIPSANTNTINYNGGHNATAQNVQTPVQPHATPQPNNAARKSGEFDGSNPYAKN